MEPYYGRDMKRTRIVEMVRNIIASAAAALRLLVMER